MEKGSNLQIGGQVPWVCHLKMASGTWTWEKTSHLLNTSSKHQERCPWVSWSCWILPDLGFSEIAKPLYEATAGSGKDTLDWGPKKEKAFSDIKSLLTSAPALRLPDVTWDFNLFVHEKIHTALWVLTQTVGPWQRPVAYLSKWLDPMAAGWLPCLWTLASTVVLVREADKLMLGQNISVKVPHALPWWTSRGISGWPTPEWHAIRVCFVKTHGSALRLCRCWTPPPSYLWKWEPPIITARKS